MAAVNVFQNEVVPSAVRKILEEGGSPVDFWVGDGKADTYLSINLPDLPPIQIPRIWEVDAGHPLTLKNWIAAKIHVALVNTRSAR
jgi:hypothetical protein